MKKNVLYSLLLLLLVSFTVKAEDNVAKGKIIGKVVDKANNEPIIGLVVLIDGTSIGTQTNFDGQYELLNLKPGSYKLVFKYLSYNTKFVEGVIVNSGKTTTLNVAMEEQGKQLQEVVVRSTYKKESLGALYTIQKNNVSISDGISSDIIKKSPDRNTSEVLRRVSGASIQDNKFVVIRGLSDRYNVALINGSPLPSTEPDRRAFSFDIFPANLLDNMTVTKAATPDLPGDFAGGVIQLNTKDFPEEKFFNVNMGLSFNTISTGKKYFENSSKGKYDFLGVDDGTRAIPDGVPSEENYPSSAKKAAAMSRLFQNDWGYNENASAAPGGSFQILYGNKNKIADKDFGYVYGITYSNSIRYNQIERQDFDNSIGKRFIYQDDNYKNNISLGGLLNLSYQTGKNSKVSLKNIYNINTDINTIIRNGLNLEDNTPDTVKVKSYNYEFTSKKLLSSQVNFEKIFPTSNIKFKANGGVSVINRDEPDSRSLQYSNNITQSPDAPMLAQINFTPDKNARKFYSQLNEQTYSFGSDVTVPFNLFKDKSSVKVGVYASKRQRDFSARFFGFKRQGFPISDSVLSLGPDHLFDVANLADSSRLPLKGFILEDITNPTARYNAQNNLSAAYIMFDNHLLKNLRVVWGARVESNNIQLESPGDSMKIDTTNIDVLPSVNFTYALTPKTNLRLAYSKTVSRPEFRELATFEYEDFITNTLIQGNPNIKRALISNYDVRWEYYPNAGEIISLTGFYKNFKDPIESVYLGGSNKTKTFQNVTEANNYGVEFELRKKFNFLNSFDALAWEQWDNLVFYANVSLIKSTVDLRGNINAADSIRPLQGQSPYIINAGLQYSEPNSGLNFSVLYNVIGRRIIEAGFLGYENVWEAPRNLLDVQLSKTFMEHFELKMNVSDILNQKRVYYQDIDKNKVYNVDKDNKILSTSWGTTYSFSLAYKF
ncbi:MAG: TonB-dependent receptor [Sphingobacteriales bacterium]|nr:TonB-dependent receptor [Sphingobacteriales bacterium]